MSKLQNIFNECIKVLKQIHKLEPHKSLATHLSNALADYGNFWGLGDKETLFALTKYKVEIETDFHSDEDIEKIVSDGTDLLHILDEEDEEDGS